MQSFKSKFLILLALNLCLSVVFFQRASSNQSFGYTFMRLESERKLLQNQYEQLTLDLSTSKSLKKIYQETVSDSNLVKVEKEFVSNYNNVAYVK